MLGWRKHKLDQISITKRNISNLRFADDTTLMAERTKEEELKSLSLKVKEDSEKVGLN